VANAAVYAGADGARIVVGAVGGRPQRMSAAEDLLLDGGDPSAIADAVRAAVEPLEDARLGEDYKRHLAAVAVARCLRTVLEAA
jgi:CO/xanthine dehydrogenase FAD-binding subunit